MNLVALLLLIKMYQCILSGFCYKKVLISTRVRFQIHLVVITKNENIELWKANFRKIMIENGCSITFNLKV